MNQSRRARKTPILWPNKSNIIRGVLKKKKKESKIVGIFATFAITTKLILFGFTTKQRNKQTGKNCSPTKKSDQLFFSI